MSKNTKDMKNKASSKEVVKDSRKRNQATEKAGLSFNVNSSKTWIKKQFEGLDLEVPKFSGAHIALTAIIESLLMDIIKFTNSKLSKSKTFETNITSDALSYPLQLDVNYAKLFKENISAFNPETNYTEQFWISRNDVDDLIQSTFGDGIHLDAKAFNLLAYLLVKYASTITRTSQHLIAFANKKTFDPKALRTAVLIHTPESISNTLITKLEEAVSNHPDEEETTKVDNKKSVTKKQIAKKDDSDDDSESESDSDSEDEKPIQKKTNAKTKTKAKAESDSESESESEDEKPIQKKTNAKAKSKNV